MPDFVTCGSCGLRHSQRPDGTCPKCKNPIGAINSSGPVDAPGAYDASAIGAGAFAAPARFQPVDLEGSFTVGFLVTLFFGGLWALAAFHIWGKPATKLGSRWAFAIQVTIALIAAIAIPNVVRHAHQLTPYEDVQRGWRMKLPRTRVEKVTTSKGASGDVVEYAVISDLGKSGYYVAAVNMEIAVTPSNVDRLLDGAVKGGALKRATIETTTPILLGDVRGREVRFNQDGREGVERIYIDSKRLYDLVYAAPRETFDLGEWKPAFDSFEFIN